MPRPAFLVVASLVSATSHFILAVSTSEVAFTLGVTLSGVAFGMVWPMMYVCLPFFVNIMRDHNSRVYSFVISCHSHFFVLAHLNDTIAHTQPYSRVLITGEVFGNRHVGANYMVCLLLFV